jgi:MFS family permease
MAAMRDDEHVQVDVHGQVIGPTQGGTVSRCGGHGEVVAVDRRGDGHNLFHPAESSLAVHIGGMYLPSPLTGLLIDRYGRIAGAVASGLTLLAAGILGAAGPADSVVVLALALGLLGLGWNLGLVAGTAMITDAAPLQTRAKTQGTIDLCVALAGSGAGISSGMIMSATSYAALSLGGGILALAIIPLITLRRRATSGV